MNPINYITLDKANEEAIFNVYIYMAHLTMPQPGEEFRKISERLDSNNPGTKIIKNAIGRNKNLGESRLINFAYSKSGLTACSFSKPNGEISVIFRGTGSNEWTDNGEGLSGIAETNTYFTCAKNGSVVSESVAEKDFATYRQVEALNWFNCTAAQNGWNEFSAITLSGHSKGGNKAQFIAINSDLVDECISFSGQGFSPEAIDCFQKRFGNKFHTRRKKIISLSADNDYVNIWGKRLMPEENIYYFEAKDRLHPPEAILNEYGSFRPRCEQGALSACLESVSDKLMSLPPSVRQYATVGAMRITDRLLNSKEFSVEKAVSEIRKAYSK